MRRRDLLGAFASAAAAGALGTAALADVVPVRIGVGSADTFAEGFYATDMGFFTKAGLDVQMTVFNSGANVLEAAAANAIDVGISNTGNLANAIAHAAPFTFIAGAGLYTGAHATTVLTVPIKSPLKTPADLVGKTIAVTALKDLTEVGTRAWLAKNNVNPDQVKFVELSMNSMAAGLDRGTFDAAIIGEPQLSSALGKTIRIFANAYDAVGPQFLIANWFSTIDFVKKNPETVKRLVASIYDTARWANANRPASGQILAKWAKLDPAVVASMGRCEYATSLDARLLNPVFEAMYRFKAIDRKLSASDVVTTLT